MVSRQNVKSGAARRVARVAMLLVKLGGSVLTDKTRLRTARRAGILRLASELAAVLQSLVVVHRAASCRHILARRPSSTESSRPIRSGAPALPGTRWQGRRS